MNDSKFDQVLNILRATSKIVGSDEADSIERLTLLSNELAGLCKRHDIFHSDHNFTLEDYGGATDEIIYGHLYVNEHGLILASRVRTLDDALYPDPWGPSFPSREPPKEWSKGWLRLILQDGHLDKFLEGFSEKLQGLATSHLATSLPKSITMENTMNSPIRVFISHSSHDLKLVKQVVDVLKASMEIPDEQIRCTSLPGYQLTSGDHTSITLKAELQSAEVIIGVLTPNSLKSSWVLFELGAGWILGKWVAPLLAAGADYDELPGPLKECHAIKLSKRNDVEGVLDDIVSQLQLKTRSTSSRRVAEEKLVALAKELEKNRKDHTDVEDGKGDVIEGDESDRLLFFEEEILGMLGAPRDRHTVSIEDMSRKYQLSFEKVRQYLTMMAGQDKIVIRSQSRTYFVLTSPPVRIIR